MRLSPKSHSHAATKSALPVTDSFQNFTFSSSGRHAPMRPVNSSTPARAARTMLNHSAVGSPASHPSERVSLIDHIVDISPHLDLKRSHSGTAENTPSSRQHCTAGSRIRRGRSNLRACRSYRSRSVAGTVRLMWSLQLCPVVYITCDSPGCIYVVEVETFFRWGRFVYSAPGGSKPTLRKRFTLPLIDTAYGSRTILLDEGADKYHL